MSIEALRRGIQSLPKGVRTIKTEALGTIGFSFKDPRNELVIFERRLAAALNKSIRDAGPAYVSGLSKALDAAMETPLPWDGYQRRVTKRKNSSIATYPRNIVDLGELKASKKLTLTATGVNIEYTADHAASVYYGFRHVKSGEFIPPRPWIALAVNERLNDPKGDLNKLLRDEIARLTEEQIAQRRGRR